MLLRAVCPLHMTSLISSPATYFPPPTLGYSKANSDILSITLQYVFLEDKDFFYPNYNTIIVPKVINNSLMSNTQPVIKFLLVL